MRAVREHGPGVGMDDIAAAAGTSKTVVYRHFTDRAGLYAAVADRVDGTIIRGITRAAEREGAGTAPAPRAVVRAVIAAYLHLVEDDPEVYRFIVNAPILPPGERPDGDVAAGMTGRIAAHVADIVGGRLGDGRRRHGAALGHRPRRDGARRRGRLARRRRRGRRGAQCRRPRRGPHHPGLGRPRRVQRPRLTRDLPGQAVHQGRSGRPWRPSSSVRAASTWCSWISLRSNPSREPAM